jgi:hypothetical protein
MRRVRAIAVAAVGIVFSGVAEPRDLTPAIKARLFAPTADVRLTRPVVKIAMRGTDQKGNRKCPYFRVYVNGKGPFTFVYDLGASYTLVSSKVVEATKANVVFDRGGQRDVVQLDRLSLGGVALHNLWAIQDDTFVSAVGVDGIIGFPALGEMNVLFDLSRREIRVSRTPIPMSGSFSLRYEAPFNVPTIPVRIGSRTVPILIDTGDDAYGLEIRSSELGDAAVTHPPQLAAAVMNGATKQQTFVTSLRDPVVLGQVSAVNGEIAINDDLPVGDFGYYALRQFRFQIEPKRHQVVFQPLFEGSEFKLRNDP